MTTEVQKLEAMLAENELKLISVFRGSNPNVTQEQLAAEVHRAIGTLVNGEFVDVTILDDE